MIIVDKKAYNYSASDFTKIRFRKQFFTRISIDTRRLFVNRFLSLLNKGIDCIFNKIKPDRSIKIEKCDKENSSYPVQHLDDGYRLLYFFENDTIILGEIIPPSQHDNQTEVFDKYSKNGYPRHGLIEWPMGKFKELLEGIKCGQKNINDLTDIESAYVLDENQEEAVLDFSDNVSIVGNAGSGKSLVGNRWFMEYLYFNNDARCLYLTMSKNLCEERSEYAKKEELLKNVVYKDIFSFFNEYLAILYGKNATRPRFQDSEDSYISFKNFCKKYLEELKLGDVNEALGKEGLIYYLWNKLHGQYYGALSPNLGDTFYRKKQLEPEVLSFEDVKRLDIKDGLENSREYLKGISNIYNRYYDDKKRKVNNQCILNRYEEYKGKYNYSDDNDLARIILKHSPIELGYDCVFIDECQDLTELQLLALFYIFKEAKHRVMASDRCQILQPTYFKPGTMLYHANAITSGRNENTLTEYKSVYLNYNYRSTRHIVALQNIVVQEIGNIISLKTEERQEIRCENEDGLIPIWIVATKENKQLLESVLQRARLKSPIAIISNRNDAYSYGLSNTGTPVTHKGMQYPFVVENEILKELPYNNENKELALTIWRRFYVAVTRPESALIIVEEDDGPSGEFLNYLYDSHVIEKCQRLDNYTSERIEVELNKFTIDEVEKNTLKAFESGQYKAAIAGFFDLQKISGHDYSEMIEECECRIAIKERDYENLVDFAIEHPRRAEECFAYLKTRPDLDNDTYLAIRLMEANGDYKNIGEIYQDYFKKSKSRSKTAIVDKINSLSERYPKLAEDISVFLEFLTEEINEKILATIEKMKYIEEQEGLKFDE